MYVMVASSKKLFQKTKTQLKPRQSNTKKYTSQKKRTTTKQLFVYLSRVLLK